LGKLALASIGSGSSIVRREVPTYSVIDEVIEVQDRHDILNALPTWWLTDTLGSH
jgi:hypothetical protein